MPRRHLLSKRESDVLDLMCQGQSPAEIAVAQYVAISTIRSRTKSIYMKLGVNHALAAVAYANKAS